MEIVIISQLTQKILNSFESEESLTQLIDEIIDNKINLSHLEEEAYHPLLRNIVSNITSSNLSKELIGLFLKTWITNINEQIKIGMGDHVGNQLLIVLEPLAENLNLITPSDSPQSFFQYKKRKNPDWSLEKNNFKRIKLVNTFSQEHIDQINNSNLDENKKKNLIKYQVQLDFYLSNFSFLNNLGFNNIEIDKIILHKNSYHNINAILQHQHQLLPIILPEQITKLLKFSSATLEAFLNSYQQLLKYQFELNQIVKIGEKPGGASKLKILGQHISKFSDSGFSPKHILALLPAGYNVILYICEHLDELLIEYSTPEEIIKIALKTNIFTPVINEKRIRDNVPVRKVANPEILNDSLYFDDPADLDEINTLNRTLQDGELDFYPTHFALLQTMGYTSSQIDKIMSQKNYEKNTRALTYLHPQLIKFFTHEQLAKIAARESGATSLKLLAAESDNFSLNGFSSENILSLMRTSNKIFRFVSEHAHELIAKNYTPKQIVHISFYSDALIRYKNIINNQSENMTDIGKGIFNTQILNDTWYLIKDNDKTYLYYFFSYACSIHTIKHKVAHINHIKKNHKLEGTVRGYGNLKAIKIEESLFKQLLPSHNLYKVALTNLDFKDVSVEPERYFQIANTEHVFLKCDSTPQIKMVASRLTNIEKKIRELAQETGETLEGYGLHINSKGIVIDNYGAYIDILTTEFPEKYARIPSDLKGLPILPETDEMDSNQEFDNDINIDAEIDKYLESQLTDLADQTTNNNSPVQTYSFFSEEETTSEGSMDHPHSPKKW